QLGDRYRARSCDVAGCVLGGGPDVEHQDLTTGEPGGELVAADDLDPVAAAQVGVGELAQAGHMVGGHLLQGRPQPGDLVAGQRVEDAGAVPAPASPP